MDRRARFAAWTFGLCAFICGLGASAQAEESITPSFNERYEAALTKARQACHDLWSNHKLDRLRSRIPLDDEKPTLSMLTNTEKLLPKDRPLADMAINTLGKCRAAYAPIYTMLPPQVNNLIQSVQRRQDDVIARLYNGSITFGRFNVAMNELTGKLWEALSGIPSQTKTAAAPEPTKMPAQSHSRPLENAPVAVFHDRRLALVIGNSDYTNLPRLTNPANDAVSISDVLKKMGYQTHLVLNAPTDTIRNAARKFASESENADVAVVYYAGHGAQLNGSNYVLPTDMDIPRTSADIQFAGLKIDDLVNSIGSNTKIIFLDACRDNPVLFKRLVSGRGAPSIGLAPASASNFTDARPGGGVFIAYATDAGATADDGSAAHSPFTEALLRYMQKPMSIDDMFSLVTREVRLVTKNAQRPYKYASLENIVCLTPACSSKQPATVDNVIEQSKHVEADELRVALEANNVNALETYLQNYPDTTKRGDILSRVAALKRSEFAEWTLYDVVAGHLPQFIQLTSIRRFGGTASAKIKRLVVDPPPEIATGRPISEAAYTEDVDVFDCGSPRMAVAETSVFNTTGTLVYHYKWADPQYLDLTIGAPLAPGSTGSFAASIACHEELGIPLLSKEEISKMKFRSLSSTVSGDGDIFYKLLDNDPNDRNQKRVLGIIRFNADHNLSDTMPKEISIEKAPTYRLEVDDILFKCNEDKFGTDRNEWWNASHELVRMGFVSPPAIHFSELQTPSPLKTLQMIVCGRQYVGLGVRFEQAGGAIKIAEVFDGSPAWEAGVKGNDTIESIDEEPVAGLTLAQIVQKAQGPAGSNVTLTVRHEGEDKPVTITVSRRVIQMEPAK
jgi:uncharacterized caspase-like protein